MLIPNNKQKTKLIQCFGVSRFAYNWTLGKQQENYKNGGKFISDNELRKEFTKLKKTKEYEWLNQYSNNIPKQAIKDCCEAYERFLINFIISSIASEQALNTSFSLAGLSPLAST